MLRTDFSLTASRFSSLHLVRYLLILLLGLLLCILDGRCLSCCETKPSIRTNSVDNPGAIFVEQTHDGINLVARKKQSDGLQPASKFSFT